MVTKNLHEKLLIQSMQVSLEQISDDSTMIKKKNKTGILSRRPMVLINLKGAKLSERVMNNIVIL